MVRHDPAPVVKLPKGRGAGRDWPVGLERVHGTERGHRTARERGESGAEGAGAGKKKERRRETLTSGTERSASGTGEVRLTCGTYVSGGRSARRGPKRSASGVGASWAD